jgi:hypothetical protein
MNQIQQRLAGAMFFTPPIFHAAMSPPCRRPARRHCERNKVKRSNPDLFSKLDCFVAEPVMSQPLRAAPVGSSQ